ncbi:hypothetical protein CPR19088_GLDEOEPO_02023 [Companilactobacillus paralimentarius]|uniref:Phosphoglycerate mutase n=1 Tax=Companilactobacillus nantensis DSM 16982 TaxID=1423774 RepID=A0A0R1WA72_9LACO|nr:hypothetical protein FD31_GL001613 [Companilactobacillus nantensis DSM 16982]GEO63808.1 hypothetical protein LNA01_09910 [Companilactobacillus nantensis]
MVKTLYLMRHGQTLFNQLHLIQGACDSPLTSEGIESAKKASAYLKVQALVLIMCIHQPKSGPQIL